jgi:acetyl-CoA carboxylase biotin carboxyl carrier protein
MNERIVRSPYPGTFYRRPDPEAEPYVVEGDIGATGDVVGLIEIMKSFYEVKSEEGGTVDRFLASPSIPTPTEIRSTSAAPTSTSASARLMRATAT